jgi:uncharacterized protein with HEPN domain
MKRKIKDYLFDVVDSILKIEIFTENLSYNEFINDDKTFYAVIRALEVIGEAAKKIPQPIKDKNRNIPWKQISGMRDKLIHDYFGVDPAVVWETIKTDIPFIKPLIEELYNKA